MKIYSSIFDLVGNTPLLRLHGYEKQTGVDAQLYAKLEYFNPAGSSKDRIAKNILLQAEKRGDLKAGGTVIEPTSGNTGIALAAFAAVKGYQAIIVMPDTMSKERIALIRAYGAKIELTDGKRGMQGAIERANELQKSIPNSIVAGQFVSPDNPNSHYLTTGKEIWQETDGEIDVFVATVGTGGTISGTAKYLKEQNPNIKVIAVEPLSSPVLSGGKAGAHKIQGIGAGFIPQTLDTSLIDEVLCVSDEDAYKAAQLLAKKDGVFVGISSGAAAFAAAKVAEKYKGKRIITLFPDGGARYLSTPDFID